MKLSRTLLPAALFCLSGLGFQAHAQSTASNAPAVMSEEQIDQRYDAAKDACDAMSGDQKDLCEEKAKAERDTAKANAEAAEKSTDAQRDAAETKYKADWEVAKERCDTMSGDAKDACMNDAKARFHK